MAADGYGDKGEPEFDDGGAPDTAVDPTLAARYAGIVGNRIVGTSTERAAFSAIWAGFSGGPWAGLEFYETDTTITYRWFSGAWKAWASDWIAYTPTLTAAAGGWAVGTGGNAQNTAAYQYVNGTLSMKGRQFFGTSGRTVFTNTPHVLLPPSITLVAPALANEIMAGSLAIFDAGVASAEGVIRYSGTSVDRLSFAAGRGTGIAAITNTSPYTFGQDDGFAWNVSNLILA